MIIINFHNILAGTLDAYDRSLAPRLHVSEFAATIDRLARRFELISLDELVRDLGGASNHGRAVAALTFDDGYLGVLHCAFPILRERGIVASVMVVSQALRAPTKLFHFEELELAFRISKARTLQLPGRSMRPITSIPERIACLETLKQALKVQPELQRAELHGHVLRQLGVTRHELEDAAAAYPAFRKLNVEHLNSLVESGWGVGVHSRTHRTLSCLNERDLVDEIVGARNDVQSWYGPKALPFAYPYGGPQHIGKLAPAIVAESGFSCALTTTAGLNSVDTDPYQLQRIDVEAFLRVDSEAVHGGPASRGSAGEL